MQLPLFFFSQFGLFFPLAIWIFVFFVIYFNCFSWNSVFKSQFWLFPFRILIFTSCNSAILLLLLVLKAIVTVAQFRCFFLQLQVYTSRFRLFFSESQVYRNSAFISYNFEITSQMQNCKILMQNYVLQLFVYIEERAKVSITFIHLSHGRNKLPYGFSWKHFRKQIYILTWALEGTPK